MLETAPPLVFPKCPAALTGPRVCFSAGGCCSHPPLQVERRGTWSCCSLAGVFSLLFSTSPDPSLLPGWLPNSQTANYKILGYGVAPVFSTGLSLHRLVGGEGLSSQCSGGLHHLLLWKNSFAVVTSCSCPPEDLIGTL